MNTPGSLDPIVGIHLLTESGTLTDELAIRGYTHAPYGNGRRQYLRNGRVVTRNKSASLGWLWLKRRDDKVMALRGGR